MNTAQIEGMIDRICGLFPTSQIARNTVKSAWTSDDFLTFQSVEDARKIIPLVMEQFDKFPSLKEVHRVFRQLHNYTIPAMVQNCEICLGQGWDNGERWNFADKTLLDECYTEVHLGHQYRVVKRCICRK
jgi:hypothetical protein